MKKSSLLLVGFFVFSSQFLSSQVALDTVFIQNKSKVKSAVVSRYNYYPNLEAYYDKTTDLFLYKVNNSWVFKSSIPSNYRGYCFRNGLFVVLEDCVDDAPYLFLAKHKLLHPANFSSKPIRPTKVLVAN